MASWEARAKEAEAAIELAQYRAVENRELAVWVTFEQRVFVGDLGRAAPMAARDLVVRVPTCVWSEGNMVSPSDTRAQLVMDTEGRRAKENEEFSGQLATTARL